MSKYNLPTVQEIKDGLENHNAILIFEDDKTIILKINDAEASKFFSRSCNWAISGTSYSNYVEKFFIGYTENMNGSIYFMYDLTKENTDKNYILGIAIYNENGEIFNYVSADNSRVNIKENNIIDRLKLIPSFVENPAKRKEKTYLNVERTNPPE